MATNNSRDVRVGLAIETSGTEGVAALGKELHDLGSEGKAIPAAFLETAAALDKLTTKTKELRDVEAAARSGANADRAVLVSKRDELARLRIESDKAARSTAEFQAAERALKLAIVDGAASLREKKDALAAAAGAARTAAAAETTLRNELAATVTAYRQAGTAAKTAGDQQVASGEAARKALAGIGDQLRTIQQLAGAAVGGQLLGGVIGDLARTSDAYANLAARTKLATNSNAEFQDTFRGIFDVAQRTGASVDTVGAAFTRIAQAGKESGLTAAAALRLVETLTQAIQLSGASAQEAESAVTQLGQALASGQLQGDELRSLLENAPRLAKALADGLGVAVGKLKSLGEAGELTAARVISALQGQSAALNAEFEKLPLTVGRSINNLSTAWTAYIGKSSEATGASATAAKAIDALARNLDTLGSLLYSAGKAALAYQAVRLAGTFLEIGVAARTSAAAVVVNTAAVTANTAASQANAVAGAEAAASAGRFAGALASIKLFSLVAVVTNFREIGTAIGEGIAKLAGYGKAIEENERKQRADEAASRASAAAIAQVAQSLQLATEKSLGLTDQSRKLIGEFTDVVTKGGEVSDALGKITKALELGNLDGIRNAGVALDVLGQRGKISGAQIREALASALKGEDLNVFRINALAAFDQTEQGARRLQAAIDAISNESLRRAGTSLEELTSGFSKSSASAINDVDALAKTLKDLKLTGDDAGRALSKSLDTALAAANTERSVQAVIDRFESLGKSGQLAGEQLAAGLEKAREKIEALKPGIQSLDEALRNFGLKTQTELAATAEKLGASYQRIAYDARVSLADQRKAFEAYSAAAIAANGGVESSAVKVARVVLETREAALGAGKAGAEAGKATAAGFDAATASINAAAGSLSSFSDAATKARNSASLSTLGGNTYDKNGFAQDSNGNTLNLTGQAQVGADEYFDKAAYDREVFQTAGSGRPHYVDPQRFVRKKTGVAAPGRPSGGNGSAAPGLNLNSGNSGSSPANTAAPSAALAPAGFVSKGGAAASSYTVNVNIAGRSTAVQVASRPDADNLAGLLRQLGESSLRANP